VEALEKKLGTAQKDNQDRYLDTIIEKLRRDT